MARTWLITGTSSGFGRELASQLLDRGDRVVLGARTPESVQSIADTASDRALVVRLDVTDAQHIERAVHDAVERFDGVDVLVNNAGYGYRSAVEEGDDDDIRTLFDTNVHGLIAMTRAVLPGMRQRRSGVIVNLSSIAGRSVPAGSGYYGATKFAVEGLSDALRKEVGPLGIHVLVVEPSAFRTDFHGRSLHQSRNPIADYAETAGRRRLQPGSAQALQPGDPVRGVAAILTALDSPTPPFRLLLGREAVDRAREALDEQYAELTAWEDLSIAADFPDEER